MASSLCSPMHSTNKIASKQQRCLRSRKAPVKAIHFDNDLQSVQLERSTIESQDSRELTMDEQDNAVPSEPLAKRPRVALGTQALSIRQNYPQGEKPQRLAAVCPVPLPPLYGCCDNLQFDIQQDELGTRSIETQTFNYNSKFVCIFSFA